MERRGENVGLSVSRFALHARRRRDQRTRARAAGKDLMWSAVAAATAFKAAAALQMMAAARASPPSFVLRADDALPLHREAEARDRCARVRRRSGSIRTARASATATHRV